MTHARIVAASITGRLPAIQRRGKAQFELVPRKSTAALVRPPKTEVCKATRPADYEALIARPLSSNRVAGPLAFSAVICVLLNRETMRMDLATMKPMH